ncbi:hypothetical protein U91I_00150 [alpha proteobacterium U9-1i]|nr:hypothetical protein U91I_00150 [alpha proteobacterium U9-1i]
MYAAAAPTFTRMLRNLDQILEKAEAHAKAKNIDPSVFLNARLAPDMHPLTRQIQMACDSPKGAMARLAGKTPEAHADTETSFAELHARIARVIDIVNSFQPADLDGSETREITIAIPNMELKFTGQDYLLTWVFPNFYFHVTTAYAILRHNGVELGKRDFLMG